MSMIIHSNAGLPHFEGEAFPWWGGDLQTLKHFIGRDARHQRDVPDLPEGKFLTTKLDDGDALLAAFHAPNGKIKGGIIAVHGLAGCMDSDHINVLTTDALARGFAILRVNMRGAGPTRPLAKRSYSAKSGDDLLPFIPMIRKGIREAGREEGEEDVPVIMVAHSIGGAAALNMILDHPKKLDGLDGLVSIAAPIDMMASSRRFHHLRNRVYMRHLLGRLKKLADDVPALDPELQIKIKAVPTIKAFDDVYTGPMMGYRDAFEYYEAATTFRRLTDPAIPVLLIHADNDPWIPVEAYRGLIPSAHLDIALSRGGGHVGFHDRLGVWSNRTVFAWIDRRIDWRKR